MTSLRMTAFLAAITFAAASPFASAEGAQEKAAPASMTPPKPAAELEQLKYFEGTWNCTGKAFASPEGPEHANKGTATIKLDVDKFWYAVRYEEQASKNSPRPTKLAAFWGYQAATKSFVAASFDNLGNSALESSKGWDGDKLVWTGPMVGRRNVAIRDTFTKKGDAELVHLGETRPAKGDWTKLDEETCKKAASHK